MTDSVEATYYAAGVLSGHISAAGLTILLYDLVITSGKEIRLIWSAKLSLAKLLYLYNRYTVPVALAFNIYMMSGMIPDLSNEFCARYTLGLAIYQLTESMGVIAPMLVLRVYALYNRNWRILAGLLVLACSGLLASLTLVVYGMATEAGQIGFVPLTHECAYLGVTPYISAAFLLLNLFSLCFESTIITLIVRRTWRQARSKIPMPLSEVLLRDGLAYYGVMISLLIFGLIVTVALPEYWSCLYLIWAMHSTLISRIYLHLRDVSNPVDWATNTDIRQLPRPMPPHPSLPMTSHPDIPATSFRAPSRGPSRRGHLRLLSDVTEIEDFVVEITHRPIDYYDDWADTTYDLGEEEVVASGDGYLPPIQEEDLDINDAEIGIAL